MNLRAFCVNIVATRGDLFAANATTFPYYRSTVWLSMIGKIS
jgi:hypothetical protein